VVARLKVLIPVLAAAAFLAVPAANAGLLDPVTQLLLPTCGTNTHPFSQWGDSSNYYGFGNNGFENGTRGWTLSDGAYVGIGNEPWFVNGWGSRALTLPAGASALSPTFCINLLDPALRMFARGNGGDSLHVQVLFRGLTGNLTGILNVADVDGHGFWWPTQRVSSALALPLLTQYAQIRITAGDSAWQVDDVFVDPYINRIG
jgi:hypothetical protein